MTYEELAAEEVLALPERELLDPLNLWDLVHWVLNLSLGAATADAGGEASSQQQVEQTTIQECNTGDCVQEVEQTNSIVVDE